MRVAVVTSNVGLEAALPWLMRTGELEFHRPETHENAAAAHIHVTVLDLGTTEQGLELASELKLRRTDLPIIVLGDTAGGEVALDDVDVLSRPIDLEELRVRLESRRPSDEVTGSPDDRAEDRSVFERIIGRVSRSDEGASSRNAPTRRAFPEVRLERGSRTGTAEEPVVDGPGQTSEEQAEPGGASADAPTAVPVEPEGEAALRPAVTSPGTGEEPVAAPEPPAEMPPTIPRPERAPADPPSTGAEMPRRAASPLRWLKAKIDRLGDALRTGRDRQRQEARRGQRSRSDDASHRRLRLPRASLPFREAEGEGVPDLATRIVRAREALALVVALLEELPALASPSALGTVLAEELLEQGVSGSVAVMLRLGDEFVVVGGSDLTRAQEHASVPLDHALVRAISERPTGLLLLEGGHGGTAMLRGVPGTSADPVGVIPVWAGSDLLGLVVLGGLAGRPQELLRTVQAATEALALERLLLELAHRVGS